MFIVVLLLLSINCIQASGNNFNEKNINHRFHLPHTYAGLKFCDVNPVLRLLNKTRIMELEHNEWHQWDFNILERTMILARNFAKGNDYYLTKKHVSDFTSDLCGDNVKFTVEAPDYFAYPPNAVVPCSSPMKLYGINDDSGKFICEGETQLNVANCTIFSLGSNNQFDFEEYMYKAFPQCTMRTFDCTSNPPRNPIPNLIFEKYCLGSRDEVINGRQYLTIQTLMEKSGVNHVQFFKMDIEGYEMEVFDAMLRPPYPPSLPFQLSFETHMWQMSAITAFFHTAVFEQLRIAGYRPLHRQNNRFCNTCNEHSYIRVFC